MNRSKFLPWLMLAIWSAWICALQGLLRDTEPLSAWVPDLWLVLVLALASRLERSDLPRVALVAAAGRLAVSIEPAAAVLAGALGVVLLVRVIRSVIEVEDVVARTALAFVCALALARWQSLVLETRAFAGAEMFAARLSVSWGTAVGSFGPDPWSRAAVTALAALAAAPALAHLPGLTPLRKRRTWRSVASARSF